MTRIHRRLSQLVGVHLTQTLITLNGFLIRHTLLLQRIQKLVQLLLRVGVHHLVRLATAHHLHTMQRRNRSVHATRLNQRAHVTVEQGQQQGTNVGAVHVRIGHHNDLAVASRLQVKGTTRARTDHLNQRRALSIREHISHRSTLSVQNLTANRQQSLIRRRTRQTRRTQRRVTLHNEQLRMLNIGRTAIHQLGGHGRRLQRGLTALSFLMDARRNAGLHLRDDLLAQSGRLSLLRTGGRLQASLQGVPHNLRDNLANRRGTQNLLGLTLKLRLGKTHGQHGG